MHKLRQIWESLCMNTHVLEIQKEFHVLLEFKHHWIWMRMRMLPNLLTLPQTSLRLPTLRMSQTHQVMVVILRVM
ncbi:hypothetical protein AQUCO_05200001v1 [Aquilegia coerulea]|uniref:Uncharacterized protein n=1 Tax=Aquilegia coerulea TaxID=218851 RepID=A0A2G5CIJ8_AQUCA|nr:hypothetical protein AQUCO_05200001v1 [Aquilegia coerulea]